MVLNPQSRRSATTPSAIHEVARAVPLLPHVVVVRVLQVRLVEVVEADGDERLAPRVEQGPRIAVLHLDVRRAAFLLPAALEQRVLAGQQVVGGHERRVGEEDRLVAEALPGVEALAHDVERVVPVDREHVDVVTHLGEDHRRRLGGPRGQRVRALHQVAEDQVVTVVAPDGVVRDLVVAARHAPQGLVVVQTLERGRHLAEPGHVPVGSRRVGVPHEVGVVGERSTPVPGLVVAPVLELRAEDVLVHRLLVPALEAEEVDVR
ncbi:hypothetical protein [Nocardioides pyridinolyticus]